MRKKLCYFLSALLVFSTCMSGGTVRTLADDGGTPSAVVESSDNDNDQDKADNSTTTGAQELPQALPPRLWLPSTSMARMTAMALRLTEKP